MNLFHTETRRHGDEIYFFSFLSLCLCASVRKIWKLHFILLILFLFFSCTRNTEVNSSNSSVSISYNGAKPMAVLQTGENPIWFQLTENGPVHIGNIEDAVNTVSPVPWPYAYNICFLQEKDGELIMVLNRGGFIKIAHNVSSNVTHDAENKDNVSEYLLYYFSGGEMWQNFTCGGLIYYDEKPVSLIYYDNRFLDSDLPQPKERTWSFNMDSNNIFPVQIPVLRFFPQEEGWEFDVLRLGEDGLFYFRAAKRSAASPVVQMFRSKDLEKIGEEISIDVFYNSFPKSDGSSETSLLDLPEGFVFTQIEEIGNSIFALWEEQHDYSIGAAGFMLKRK